MRLLKVLKKVVRKRFIEFILMFSIISAFLFGVLMMGARRGTGILYQLGDDWYIDPYYRHNHSYYVSYLGIKNPESFPHVLNPENNGTEVHYLSFDNSPILAIYTPHFIWFISIDLIPVYTIKHYILHISVVVILSSVLIYFYLNRRRIPLS